MPLATPAIATEEAPEAARQLAEEDLEEGEEQARRQLPPTVLPVVIPSRLLPLDGHRRCAFRSHCQEVPLRLQTVQPRGKPCFGGVMPPRRKARDEEVARVVTHF